MWNNMWCEHQTGSNKHCEHCTWNNMQYEHNTWNNMWCEHCKLTPQDVNTIHPCHQLCHRPPDDRPEQRQSLIGQLKTNIQQYLAEEPLSNISYKSVISSIHQDVVRNAIESNSSKLLNGRPPPISTAEQTLPRKTRTILAQLRTGHSRILGQYMNRYDRTAHNHCHNCGHSPHDTHHLFNCPSKPTTLTVESSWTAPTKTAKHLYLAIDETS